MLLVDDKYCVYVPEKSEMQGLKIIWYLKCHADLISVFSIMLCRGVEQLVARWAHNPKVVGSSPSPATKDFVKSYWKAVNFPMLFLLCGKFYKQISFDSSV